MRDDHKLICELARIGHEAAVKHMASIIDDEECASWDESEPLHRECMIAAVQAIVKEIERKGNKQ